MKRLFLILLFIFIIAGYASADIKIQSDGQFAVDTNGFPKIGGMSGITYVSQVDGEKDTYLFYVVSDNGTGTGKTPRYFDIKIKLDLSSGKIISAKISAVHNLPIGFDLEGIVYNPISKTVYISDENRTNPQIREFSTIDGSLIKTLTIPPVFSNSRDNYGFESLSLLKGGAALWTASEEALPVDGELSSTTTGTLVRLLEFDSKLNSVAQYAYQTDPKEDNALMPSVTKSGVSDLCVLPDGTLLALERCLGYNFRTRIYQVDFTDAANVSSFSSINANYIKKTSKTLLFEKTYDVGDTSRNYEGICLGPKLADGRYSMIMIADHGVGKAQYIYSLDISGIKETSNPTDLRGLLLVPPIAAGFVFLKRRQKNFHLNDKA